jgi:hypothetical protein
VYELHDVGTDGCGEDLGKRGGGGLLSGEGEDGKYGTCGHDESLVSAILRCGPVSYAIKLKFCGKNTRQIVSDGLWGG